VHLAQARIELPALGAHALQRLAQRGDLRPLGFQRQRQRVQRIAHDTGGIAGQVARFGQLAAFALQPLPGRLQVAHAADRSQPRGALQRLLVVGFKGFGQLAVRLDALDAVRAASTLPCWPCNWPASSDTAAMGLVQRTLRVFALLFGGLQLLAEAGQLFFQLGLAVLQLLDLLTQFHGSRVRAARPAGPRRDTRTSHRPTARRRG
jgi:hypothetical protein